MEEAFEVHTPGVINVKNGYAALNTDAVTALPNPTFDNHNGYVEAVWIEYESSNITLSQLIDYYLRNIDPYNKGGQFVCLIVSLLLLQHVLTIAIVQHWRWVPYCNIP